MSFPPPEPTPENNTPCPHCGEPISREGLSFIGYTAEQDAAASRIIDMILAEREHADPVGPDGEEGPHGPHDLPGPAGPE